MNVAYLFAILSVLFLVAGALRLVRDRGRGHPRSRAWLLIGAIFGVVSAWLLSRG